MEFEKNHLYHSNLSVGHGYQSFIDQLVCEWIPRLSLHDVRLGLLVGHGDGRHHVRPEVDAENGDGAKWKRDVGQDEEQEGGDLRDVRGQCVCNGLLEIVKDQTA